MSESAMPDLKQEKTLDYWYGVRHTQMLLLFLLLTIGYGMRANLSVGIVAMTDPTTNPDFPTYDWDDSSTVLSSFFWGYVVTQIPGGQLAKAFGPKWFLAGSMAVTSLFSLLIPIMADLGSWGVMVCRIMQGLGQGFFYPSIHHLLSKWAPTSERSRLGSFVFAGGAFGTVISMPVTGWISGSAVGWPGAFYLYGIVGFFWVFVWICLGANSPAEHTSIEPQEKCYIQSTLGHDDVHKEISTPWSAIATSLPFWAILITHCTQNWGFFTLLTEIPTYMNKVLSFDIKSNGLLSACPYFAMWLMGFVFSSLIDFSINRNLVSIGNGRKIANSFGLFGPAVALVLLGSFVKGSEDGYLAISLLIIALGFNAGHMCGYNVNHIDLSPNHAGTLMGITNTAANVMSIIGPLLVQIVVTNEEDVSQWKIVFYVASAVYAFGTIFFIAAGSGKVQPWNDLIQDKHDIESRSSKPVKEKFLNKNSPHKQ